MVRGDPCLYVDKSPSQQKVTLGQSIEHTNHDSEHRGPKTTTITETNRTTSRCTYFRKFKKPTTHGPTDWGGNSTHMA